VPTPPDETVRTELTLVVRSREALLLNSMGAVLVSAPREGETSTFELTETHRSLQRAQAAIHSLGPRTDRVHEVESTLEHHGRLLGRSLPRKVTDRLAAELERGGIPGGPLPIALDMNNPVLRDLPWEAVILPGDTAPLSLRPDAVLYRRQRTTTTRNTVFVLNSDAEVHLLAALADPVDSSPARSSRRFLDLENETRRLRSRCQRHRDASRSVCSAR